MTLISAPLQGFMPVRETILQPMSFGEIERPTTNPFPSLLWSLPEDFLCQPPKYESDVLSHNRRWLRIKTGTFLGSSRNRGIIGQANRAGISGEIKILAKSRNNKRYEKLYPYLTHMSFHAAICR